MRQRARPKCDRARGAQYTIPNFALKTVGIRTPSYFIDPGNTTIIAVKWIQASAADTKDLVSLDRLGLVDFAP